jgi:hypothetical protein
MIVKKQVLVEQRDQITVMSPNINLPSTNPPMTAGVISFTFSFLESIACIKLEPSHYNSNKKRKLLQDGAASRVSPSMAMVDFDDGDVCFGYTNVAHIPFQGV